MRLKLLALFGSLALFTACSTTTTLTTTVGVLPDFTQIVSRSVPAIVTIYVTAPMTKAQIEAEDAPPFLFDLPPGVIPFTIPPPTGPHALPAPQDPAPPVVPAPTDPKVLPKAAPKDAPKVDPKDAPKVDPKDVKPKVNHWMGSGFIIDSDGYILTNYHVIDNATTITVTLTNQREYKAKVIGGDELSDIAVIKIDAKDLPTLKLGHSSDVKPGQWVLAIGSPFNFTSSVSAGIVSAVNRDTPDNSSAYTPFIQVDAAVNHGNSGGPLLNLSGEVIGINSQIYSGTGDFAGIAFAIPIDIAMNVEQQLVRDGHVTRGRLGIVFMRVDQEKADKSGLDRPRGAFIVNVVKDSPGVAAGLKAGDIITAVNGLPIEMSSQLPVLISNLKPDSMADLKVWRMKKELTLHIKVAEMKGMPKIDPKDLLPPDDPHK